MDHRSSGAINFCCFDSSIHLMLVELGASVHPVVFKLTLVFTQCTNYSGHCTACVLGPSVHPTMSSLFFSLLGLDPQNIYCLLILACGIFASLGPRNVYKDMLNNMVNHIDHVVMNHQNHTRTNGI
jgi:hypothetical protein